MRCPFCQHTENRVLESRSAEGDQSVRRRRECLQCKRRFTTYERIEFVSITVIKRDGQRESFDRSKVLRGLVRSCEKTGIDPTKLERIVDAIEADLQQGQEKEVTSAEIGEQVLMRLRKLSEVAYVRFASVYQKFQGIRDFVKTLHDLHTHPIQSDDSEKAQSGQDEEVFHPTAPENLTDRAQWVCLESTMGQIGLSPR